MDDKETYAKIADLVARYAADRSDREAFSELCRLADESQENRDGIRRSLELWYAAGADKADTRFNPADAYARFTARKAAFVAPKASCVAPKHVAKTRRLWFRAAVAVAAVVALAFIPWASYRYGVSRVEGSFADISISTTNGAPTQTTLPDGTKVWLDASSKLTYSQGFGVTDRNVRIEGNALFDVTHNAELPFTIADGEVSLRVLGTRFTYRDYADEPSITVDLMQGSVELQSRLTGQLMRLSPDERMTIDKRSGRMSKSRTDAATSAAWASDELVFDEVPLSQIARTLSRRYGVSIHVSPALASKRLYGRFKASEGGVEHVLGTMSATGAFRYKQSAGRYIIY